MIPKSEKLHWTQEMKYLNAVADHLIELGYHVEKPNSEYREWLDVWGTYKGRRCYIEIYVNMYKCPHGINGIWHQGEHDGVEMYMDDHPLYGLDTRNGIETILDDLKPFKKGKIKWA